MANRIKEVRLEKGVSQKELAKRLGVKAPTLSQIENGKNTKIETLQKIADALDCDISELLPKFTLINDRLQEMIDNAGYRYEGVENNSIRLKDHHGIIHLVGVDDLNSLYNIAQEKASEWFSLELGSLIAKSSTDGDKEN